MADYIEDDFDEDESPAIKNKPLFGTAIKWSIAAVFVVVTVTVFVVALRISRSSSRQADQRACYAEWIAKEQEIERLRRLQNISEAAVQETNVRVKKASNILEAIVETKDSAVKSADAGVRKAVQEIEIASNALAAAKRGREVAKAILLEAKGNNSLEKASAQVRVARKALNLAKATEAMKKKDAEEALAVIQAEEANKVKDAASMLTAAITQRNLEQESLGAASETAKAEVIAARKSKAAAEREAQRITAEAKETHDAKLAILAKPVAMATTQLDKAAAAEQAEFAKITRDEETAIEVAKAIEKLEAANRAKDQCLQEVIAAKKVAVSAEELESTRERDAARAEISVKEKELANLRKDIENARKDQATLDAQSMQEWGVNAQALKDKMDADEREAIQSSETAREEARERFARLSFLAVIVFLFAVAIGYLVGVILLMAWLARDCRARGVDGGAVWVLMALFGHWITLIIYLASRPHGILVRCVRCSNKKLMLALQCPHCGVKSTV